MGRKVGIWTAPLSAAVGMLAACAACGATAATAAPTPASSGGSGAAAPAPAPAHATVGSFHFATNDFKIDSNAPSEVVMTTTVIHPGSSKGWHTHPGPGFVVVTAGTLTLYQVGSDGRCARSTYGVGQGFVEAPGVVHIARNEATVDVSVTSTYLDVAPGTTAYRSAAPAPAACPGIG